MPELAMKLTSISAGRPT